MTRKDFQAIAAVIKDTPFTDPQDRVILAHRMAEVCQRTNPNFNKPLFLSACHAPGRERTQFLNECKDHEASRAAHEAKGTGAMGFIEARDLTPEEAEKLR